MNKEFEMSKNMKSIMNNLGKLYKIKKINNLISFH